MYTAEEKQHLEKEAKRIAGNGRHSATNLQLLHGVIRMTTNGTGNCANCDYGCYNSVSVDKAITPQALINALICTQGHDIEGTVRNVADGQTPACTHTVSNGVI